MDGVKITTPVRRRQDNEHRILDELAKIMPAGKPATGVSYPAIAEQIGETAYAVLTAKSTLEDAGVLRTTIANRPGRGRVATWELAMPLDRAHEELSREHQRQLDRPSASAKRRARHTLSDGTGPLRPVAEPKLSESDALVRAAREYRDRIIRANQQVAEMRKAGIEVDESAFTVHRDERLEAIAQVLPALDQLERERERLVDQVERWRQEADEAQ